MNSNDDYESNDFIEQAKQFDQSNKLLNRKKNREEAGYNKSQEVVMFEKLSQGLNTPIESTNKGHKLLLKMGYKAGESLGRSNKGLTEPIDITKYAPILKEKLDLVNKQSNDNEMYNNILDSKMSIYYEINNKIKKIFHQKETIIRNLDTLSNLYFQRYTIVEQFKQTIDMTEFSDEIEMLTYENYYKPTLNKCISKLKILVVLFTHVAPCDECLNICSCQIHKNYQLFLDTKEHFDFNISKFFRELIRNAIDSRKIEDCHLVIEKFYNILQLSNNEIKSYICKNFLYCITCAKEFASDEEFNEHIEDCEINIS
jgi:hypothetical protein